MKATFTISKEKKGVSSFIMKGDITIRSSKTLKENLDLLLANTGKYHISLEAVTAVDVTAVQLLSAFVKQCMASARSHEITWPKDVSLNELLEKTGIKRLFQ